MTGGIEVNGTHTARDLGFCLRGKTLTPPAKKSARVTVPYMHGSYDFSDAMGDIYYQDREIAYLFDIIGDPRYVEMRISELIDWASLINDDDISDDDRPYYHYRGSFTGSEVEIDESGEMATVTLTFTCYPFAIADDPCRERMEIGDNLVINRGHDTTLTVIPDGTMTIQIGSLKQTFSAEDVADFALKHGENTVTVTNGGGYIQWYEEVI